MPDRVDDLITELRARGGRVTGARRGVLAALVSAHGHLTAEDLAAQVQAAQPDVHLSTIYRSLDALEQLGLVDHVHLGHGRAVYHLTDDPHQHLVCEECGVVIEVPDSTFGELSEELMSEYGFALRPNHFAVLGRCAACGPSGSGGLSPSGR
ncbi:MAG TPA: Fur family transcriptional regulator [Acidimicrobiales bacterium]|nr:Fur family transcriptional regulator [Acidimicrobiales bacterium]